MSHTVKVDRQAEKVLRALTDKRLYSRLRQAIDGLSENPRPSGCVKLHGASELYRVRVGDYRIVYRVQDAVLLVLVLQIGHRREIYR